MRTKKGENGMEGLQRHEHEVAILGDEARDEDVGIADLTREVNA